MKKNQPIFSPKQITLCAMFMAINVAFSSFGIPVPGGSFYLCDAIICTAAILLDPIPAFIVGGFGSFIGDFFFYPTAMFVSLVVHGLQAAAVSVISRRSVLHGRPSRSFISSLIAVAVGSAIMVVGYTLGAAFIYSTPAYAIINIPYEILQAGIGSAISLLVCYKFGLIGIFNRFFAKPHNQNP